MLGVPCEYSQPQAINIFGTHAMPPSSTVDAIPLNLLPHYCLLAVQ